ncbi:MAG TPA: ATPase, T2SS/T4P/T4SS family [Candidatus Lokiarchaeia archaeon]|nr:ATPase, T2SS/T4P/T4SS family [Candidatus Lokiarchaeia archaeon]
MRQDIGNSAENDAVDLDYYKDIYEKYPCNENQAHCTIRINCDKCGKCKAEYNFENPVFLRCIINILGLEREENIDTLQLGYGIVLAKKLVCFLKDLLVDVKNIDDFNEKFANNLKTDCLSGYRDCLLKNLQQDQDVTKLLTTRFFFTRTFGYITILRKISDFLSHNKECAKCLRIYPKEIEKLIAVLDKKQILESFLKKDERHGSGNDLESLNLLNEVFLEGTENIKGNRNHDLGNIDKKSIYYVDQSKVIEIIVSHLDSRIEKLYDVKYNFPFSEEFFRFLIKDTEKELEKDQTFLKLQDFESILTCVLHLSNKKILDTIQLEDDSTSNIISLLVAFSLLGFEKLVPLLLDENIEEIFLDSPDSCIYIHHVQFQQCRTGFILTENEIQMIMSRLRFETNRNLNDLFPSLKCVLKNSCFYARFNVDVKPLNPNGFSLDIRRLNRKIFNIFELFFMNTLNIDILVFLIFCIQTKMNLTITGRTDTGKTTLLNALDMLYPEHLRKIYVEDEIETATQDSFIFHQLKYQVSNKQTKSDLIKNLLHRSPDILILGEILTREETEALFHCISTGMKGLQTIHANNAKSLITRFLIHFGIDRTCLDDLDFILTLQKFESGERKIVEIAELIVNEKSGSIITNVISSYNPKTNEWPSIDYTSSKKVQDYLKKSKFDYNSFDDYLSNIKNIISKHINNQDFSSSNLQRDLNQVYMDHRHNF